ncbi:class F sortase [Actinomadura flavalba]|uniref:class F sortase n=1 Tax=Actinomadura flavalba TaxID=1120938 RepID=UPI00036874EE|nr:class F sortase [Actinomadura flavalba]
MARVTTPAAGRRGSLAVAGVLAGGLLLTGCGGDGGKPVAASSPAVSSPAAPAAEPVAAGKPLDRSPPKTIRIPKLRVEAPVSRLGLRPDGRIEEPPLSRPNLAGWYEKGPTPGEVGPSVVLGHVDAHKKPAVFFRLRELKKGDRIEIARQDGSVATFAVQKLESVPKKKFPGEKVYAEDIDYASLRLVTCGGAFDASTGHYLDNTIAYAKLVESA